jgi:mannose-6-phosphate isomerase-like protein (cupin superfamily)
LDLTHPLTSPYPKKWRILRVLVRTFLQISTEGGAVIVQRSGERFVSRGGGWVGRYCFSYDEHYDAANVSFGRMLACNEFVLEPGAGFGMHHHAGVDIATVVIEGVLTHVTHEGSEERPAGSYVLAAARGVEHDERNDGDVPVRFVQVWLLPGGNPLPRDESPVNAGDFVLVTSGEVDLDGTRLTAGDSARLDGPSTLTVRAGQALVWSC